MRTIRTKGLPAVPAAGRAYTFFLDEKQSPPVLHVQGLHSGPDICTPEFPQQEGWLNTLPNLLVQTWDCQWTFRSGGAVEEFLSLLGPFLESVTE